MYDEIPPHAGDFAGLLKGSFEETRAELVRNLDSHAELVEYATRAGHRTRPVGCLLAAAAVGGEWPAALDAAVAVELIHKSSVIRDDIVDGDVARSGQPALHIAFDVARAISTSDLLWTLALRRLALYRLGLQGCAVEALHEMAAGQLEDVAPSPGRDSVAQRRLVEERKTGVLSELACRLGVLIGGGTPPQVEALSQYGRDLGTAFQILNDVRNLRGEESERRCASDLRNRRDTILSAYAREVADERDRERLDAFVIGSGRLPEDQVGTLRETIIATGAAEFGERTAAELMENARRQLDVLEDSTAKEIFDSLTRDALFSYAF